MILVTGGSGFFGIHLTRRLLAAGLKVRILDTAEIEDDEIEGAVEFVRADVRDARAVAEACQEVEVVFHNAALVPLARAGKGYWDTNVAGTNNVLDACRQAQVRKVVNISTSSVYGVPSKLPVDEGTALTPLGRYGESKYRAEQLCQTYKQKGMDISIIRPRTILGPGRLGILQVLFEWVRRGRRFYIIGSGENRFQLVSARDLADACYLAGSKECFQEDFNIGAEQFATLRNDLEGLAKHAATGTRIVSIHPGIARPCLKVVDWLRLSPFVDYHYHILDRDVYFDVTKAKRVLGWMPADSNLGMLTETYDWYLGSYRELDSRTGRTHRRSVKQGFLLKLLGRYSGRQN